MTTKIVILVRGEAQKGLPLPPGLQKATTGTDGAEVIDLSLDELTPQKATEIAEENDKFVAAVFYWMEELPDNIAHIKDLGLGTHFDGQRYRPC